MIGLGDLGFHMPDEAVRLMSAWADLLEGRTQIVITETSIGVGVVRTINFVKAPGDSDG